MTASSDSFSVLLVNYRTPQLTKLCLELLKKHLDPMQTDVVVVDNGSNDESLDYLRSLSWIKLVERTQTEGEPAFISHAEAIDEGMKYVRASYVCLLHTDTFIHDPKIFDLLLSKIRINGVAAVGTKDQRHRKWHRRMFRVFKKASRYYYKKCMLMLGISETIPKTYKDIYLKSFCCMWDIRLVKKCGLKFLSATKNPGYEIQDKLSKIGFEFVDIGTDLMFKHLSHVQSGTVVELNETKTNQRRSMEYQRIIDKTKTAY